ncbi:5-oxoprolinase-like [Sitophilus oryzae]|uniref:5-oxoprolinase-like n=1 Tax=Sitophilus oryzae TaxID=7048 RepID=A0A6J2YL03_SITOR|nr:5-oxoprolinase-like [Sitophilus oryzae]
MRYDGTDCALMCGPWNPDGATTNPKHGDFLQTFIRRYKAEFGFVIAHKDVIVDDIRVRGVGKSDIELEQPLDVQKGDPNPITVTKVYFESGYEDTNVYQLKDLFAGQTLKGPAIVMDQLSTILIEPDCTAVITKYGDIKITIGTGKVKAMGPELDSIQLSIFSHRFMSIAEQMGRRHFHQVSELIDQYGLKVVQAYMGHIQTNAEIAVRDMLREVAREAVVRTGSASLYYSDSLDDGSPITLKVTLDETSGSALCDFSGSGPEVWGNCNAPRAVSLSALIYCLRCMVGHDVPLNQGCLAPVQVNIPKGSLLDPSENAAVVGGNVLTSQRIVDVVLGAFRVCAASQGCMNNITFGNEFWGCYETVAGGSGAGPNWHGCSGVHTHMTNTRITDIEIVERRYPVHVKVFTLRKDSGGVGKFSGGDGVHRELLFRAPLMLSVLTERRVLAPYGLEGGASGARGLNLLIRAAGRIINLGPKTAVPVSPGDAFRLLTPGGGGYGLPEEADKTFPGPTSSQKVFLERGSVFEYRMAQEGV